MLLDLSESLTGVEWESVTDTVMGGVSDASIKVSGEEALVFSGTVSLENSGGFASVRTRMARIDLSEYGGLLVRVLGDGKRYSLNLRTDVQIPGGSYRAGFETLDNHWQETLLPFSEFRPIAFGRTLREFPDFNSSEVRSLGFMIASGQEGPFRLEIAWIRAVV